MCVGEHLTRVEKRRGLCRIKYSMLQCVCVWERERSDSYAREEILSLRPGILEARL